MSITGAPAGAAGEAPVPPPPPVPPVPFVAVCLKLVELRAAVDPLTGAVGADPLSAGPSPADEAALEWALRIAEAAGTGVVAVTAGTDASETMLRHALAAGAGRAVRVALEPEAPSAVVAASVADAIRRLLPPAGPGGGAGSMAPVIVCCGDASADRGSGSVPAFLAGELDAAQALGLVGVSMPQPASPAGGRFVLEVERRLDRGRRERLRLTPPCVFSVEAVTARLRRASLPAVLAARTAEIHLHDAVASPRERPLAGIDLVDVQPFRPRTRVVPPPPPGFGPRERILELTGALHERPAARTLALEPEAAADELLSTLAEWGELPAGLQLAPTAADHDETEPS